MADDKQLHELDAITTPDDADLAYIEHNPATTPSDKKLTWANLKATLKAYFDALYGAIADVAQNTSDIAQNTSDIAQNTSDIAQNASDIAAIVVPVKATGAEITAGTDDAKFATAKALADADLNTRLKSKIISANRDLTAVAGNVSYTGVGFKPTSIIVLAATSNKIFSIGIADSAKNNAQINQYGTTPQAVQADFNFLNISIDNAGANAQYASISSYDSDGFTLAWTKSGTPTGTANLIFLCFR